MKTQVSATKSKPVAEIRAFTTLESWEKWLNSNQEKAAQQGIWMQLAKKVSTIKTISYAQALDVALCYGWIDGQKKAYDENFWIQKFTPRRARSIWSKINVGHTERLIKAGKMQPTGQKQIDLAKNDGRWGQAYDSSSTANIPTDLQAELDKNLLAKEFFSTLNKNNTYAIIWRLQTARKPETRLRRLKLLVGMLDRKEKIYP